MDSLAHSTLIAKLKKVLNKIVLDNYCNRFCG
ncbi:MAG: hypothetical protein H6Q73_4135 [Firmicutes bacterium]|nr:hypothetical protein [Bacillota bacterium]